MAKSVNLKVHLVGHKRRSGGMPDMSTCLMDMKVGVESVYFEEDGRFHPELLEMSHALVIDCSGRDIECGYALRCAEEAGRPTLLITNEAPGLRLEGQIMTSRNTMRMVLKDGGSGVHRPTTVPLKRIKLFFDACRVLLLGPPSQMPQEWFSEIRTRGCDQHKDAGNRSCSGDIVHGSIIVRCWEGMLPVSWGAVRRLGNIGHTSVVGFCDMQGEVGVQLRTIPDDAILRADRALVVGPDMRKF